MQIKDNLIGAATIGLAASVPLCLAAWALLHQPEPKDHASCLLHVANAAKTESAARLGAVGCAQKFKPNPQP